MANLIATGRVFVGDRIIITRDGSVAAHNFPIGAVCVVVQTDMADVEYAYAEWVGHTRYDGTPHRQWLTDLDFEVLPATPDEPDPDDYYKHRLEADL